MSQPPVLQVRLWLPVRSLPGAWGARTVAGGRGHLPRRIPAAANQGYQGSPACCPTTTASVALKTCCMLSGYTSIAPLPCATSAANQDSTCLLLNNRAVKCFGDQPCFLMMHLDDPASLCYFCSKPRQHMPAARQPRRQVLRGQHLRPAGPPLPNLLHLPAQHTCGWRHLPQRISWHGSTGADAGDLWGISWLSCNILGVR